MADKEEKKEEKKEDRRHAAKAPSPPVAPPPEVTEAPAPPAAQETIAEKKISISDAISSAFKGFLKTDREKLSEALSLMVSRKAVAPDTFALIRQFYEKDPENRRILFRILAGLDLDELQHLLDHIYAVMDTPIWITTLSEHLEDLMKELPGESAKELKPFQRVLQAYLAKIFNFQYLITREYNADNTPISILKYIANAEGVHPASHWSAFEERLNAPDRLLLGLEHFKIPNNPIVYVEIALAKGLIRKIHHILGPEKVNTQPDKADTAIFYSVNNTFRGLGGTGLGEKMIVKAKLFLKNRYPRLKLFATLSPLPGFRAWLEEIIANPDAPSLLTKEKLDSRSKNEFFPASLTAELAAEAGHDDPLKKGTSLSEFYLGILQGTEWLSNPELSRRLEKPLTALARHYLLKEKRRGPNGQPLFNVLDPVANFHFSNGATLGSINYMGNLNESGINRAFGVMVNYLYDDERLDANKIRYTRGEIDSKA